MFRLPAATIGQFETLVFRAFRENLLLEKQVETVGAVDLIENDRRREQEPQLTYGLGPAHRCQAVSDPT
jgi:hypothetical protein